MWKLYVYNFATEVFGLHKNQKNVTHDLSNNIHVFKTQCASPSLVIQGYITTYSKK